MKRAILVYFVFPLASVLSIGAFGNDANREKEVVDLIKRLNHSDSRVATQAFRELEFALETETSDYTLKAILQFLDPSHPWSNEKARRELELLAHDALQQWHFYLEAFYEILRDHYLPFQKAGEREIRPYALAIGRSFPLDAPFTATFAKFPQGVPLNADEMQRYSDLYRRAEVTARKSPSDAFRMPIVAPQVDSEGKLWFASSLASPKQNGVSLPVRVCIATNVATLIYPEPKEPRASAHWRMRVRWDDIKKRAASNHPEVRWSGALKSLRFTIPEVAVRLIATVSFGLPRVELIPARPEFERVPVEWRHPVRPGNEDILAQHWGQQRNPKSYSPLTDLTDNLIRALGPGVEKLIPFLRNSVLVARVLLNPDTPLRPGQFDFNRDSSQPWDVNLYPDLRRPVADPADFEK